MSAKKSLVCLEENILGISQYISYSPQILFTALLSNILKPPELINLLTARYSAISNLYLKKSNKKAPSTNEYHKCKTLHNQSLQKSECQINCTTKKVTAVKKIYSQKKYNFLINKII